MTVTAKDLHNARLQGQRINEKIDNLSLPFVLRGVSAYRHHDWVQSLLAIWVGVEQILSWLWMNQVVKGARQPNTPITERRKFLTDFRSWTTAVQTEVLYQLEIIDEDIYRKLNAARKARNNLIHSGRLPDRELATTVIDGFFQILSLAYTDGASKELFAHLSKDFTTPRPFEIGFVEMDVEEGRTKSVEKKGQAYRYTEPRPPIPGDLEWGDKEYEKVFADDKKTWQSVASQSKA